jgi:hypothetical protein
VRVRVIAEMGCTVVLALRHALLGGHGALGEIADHVVGELVAALDLTLGLVGPVRGWARVRVRARARARARVRVGVRVRVRVRVRARARARVRTRAQARTAVGRRRRRRA